MEAVWITVSSGEGIHRDESPNSRIHVPRPQVVEADIRVKELACKEMIIGGDASFVKQIAKGIISVGIRHGFAAGGEGSGAAEAIIVIITGRTTACLGDQIMSVHIPYQQIPAPIALFQYLGVITR